MNSSFRFLFYAAALFYCGILGEEEIKNPVIARVSRDISPTRQAPVFPLFTPIPFVVKQKVANNATNPLFYAEQTKKCAS